MFIFHEFVGILLFLLLLRSNFNLQWSDTGDYVSFLESVETCFVTKYVLSFWEGSMRCWEKGIFFCIWVWCSVRSIWVITSVSSVISLSWWPVSWWDWGVKVSYYYCVTFGLWFNIQQCLLYKCRCPLIWGIYVQIETSSCWIFLLMTIKCSFLSLLLNFFEDYAFRY